MSPGAPGARLRPAASRGRVASAHTPSQVGLLVQQGAQREGGSPGPIRRWAATSQKDGSCEETLVTSQIYLSMLVTQVSALLEMEQITGEERT